MNQSASRAIAACVLLAACATDPGWGEGRDAARYAADLAACQEAGRTEAERRALARFPFFISYPVSVPLMARNETRDCMERKGYNAPG